MERSNRPFEQSLRARVGVLTARINALQVELAAVVSTLDDEGGCSGVGYRSATHWLSVNAGLARGDAARLVRVGSRLDQIPTLAEAASRGEVGITMLDAAARISTPENEAAVAEIVLNCSPSQSQRVLSTYRRAAQPYGDAETATETGSGLDDPDPGPVRPDQLWWRDWIDDLGRGRIDAAIDPIVLEQLRLAMRAFETPPSESSEGAPQRVTAPHELVGRLADAALAHAAQHLPGSTDRDRSLIQVTADLATFANVIGATFDSRLPFGLGRQAFITSVTGRVTRLSDSQLAELLCTSRIQLLIHQNGVPLWLGNETRHATRQQRRALRARAHNTCEFPGCCATRYLEPHHVIYHSRNGETTLENLVLLCWAHHHETHNNRWVIETEGDQHFIFRDQRGEILGRRKPPDEWKQDRHLTPVHPDTPKPQWGGEPLTNYALDILVTKLLNAA